MIARLRRALAVFVALHIEADDPNPEYSEHDKRGGRLPMRRAVSGPIRMDIPPHMLRPFYGDDRS
jgi:hypothetical protein